MELLVAVLGWVRIWKEEFSEYLLLPIVTVLLPGRVP
jgi:hypothetical protein